MVYRTEETTFIDKILLWGWAKWEAPFKIWPLKNPINTIFWFHDLDYVKPKIFAPHTEVKHSHLLIRKKKCLFCKTPMDVLTDEHPTGAMNNGTV